MNYQLKKHNAAAHNRLYEEKKEQYRLAARLPKSWLTYPLPSVEILKLRVAAFESRTLQVPAP